jgi:hypothetical protein
MPKVSRHDSTSGTRGRARRPQRLRQTGTYAIVGAAVVGAIVGEPDVTVGMKVGAVVGVAVVGGACSRSDRRVRFLRTDGIVSQRIHRTQGRLERPARVSGRNIPPSSRGGEPTDRRAQRRVRRRHERRPVRRIQRRTCRSFMWGLGPLLPGDASRYITAHAGNASPSRRTPARGSGQPPWLARHNIEEAAYPTSGSAWGALWAAATGRTCSVP